MIEKLKKSKLPWLAAFLALGILLAAAIPAYADDAGSEGSKNAVISVSGKGTITVAPDVVYLSMGIQTRAVTANEAQKLNAAQFAKLKKVLTDEFKIEGKDIQTQGFYVNPEYAYADKEAPKVTGYVVNNQIKVTYRVLDKVGALLDAASAAGLNQVNSIQFGTEKAESYEVQLLEKAMANADKKAAALAKASKRTIVSVQNVTEASASVPVTWEAQYSKSMLSVAADGAAPTSVDGGQITLTATVSVTYEAK